VEIDTLFYIMIIETFSLMTMTMRKPR